MPWPCFHLNFGFRLPSQELVFTLDLDSRKYCLHNPNLGFMKNCLHQETSNVLFSWYSCLNSTAMCVTSTCTSVTSHLYEESEDIQPDSLRHRKDLKRTRNGLDARVFEGFFLKSSAIFFRQEIVNQKMETHPVKSYITQQLVINGI